MEHRAVLASGNALTGSWRRLSGGLGLLSLVLRLHPTSPGSFVVILENQLTYNVILSLTIWSCFNVSKIFPCFPFYFYHQCINISRQMYHNSLNSSRILIIFLGLYFGCWELSFPILKIISLGQILRSGITGSKALPNLNGQILPSTRLHSSHLCVYKCVCV